MKKPRSRSPLKPNEIRHSGIHTEAIQLSSYSKGEKTCFTPLPPISLAKMEAILLTAEIQIVVVMFQVCLLYGLQTRRCRAILLTTCFKA